MNVKLLRLLYYIFYWIWKYWNSSSFSKLSSDYAAWFSNVMKNATIPEKLRGKNASGNSKQMLPGKTYTCIMCFGSYVGFSRSVARIAVIFLYGLTIAKSGFSRVKILVASSVPDVSEFSVRFSDLTVPKCRGKHLSLVLSDFIFFFGMIKLWIKL